jgi:hypothetical protein
MHRHSRVYRLIAFFLAAILSLGTFAPAGASVESHHPAVASDKMAAMPGMHMPVKAPGHAHGCHDCDCPAGIWMPGANCLSLVLPAAEDSLTYFHAPHEPIRTNAARTSGLSIPPALPPPILHA